MFSDNDVEMVRYMHPNRGQHPVYGLATKKFYGMRAGGGTETFLVHRADIAAAPHYYHMVAPIPTAPRKEIVAPPPPAKLREVPPPQQDTIVVKDTIKVEFEVPEGATVRDDGVVEIPQDPDPMKRALDHARFDLQLLPGATPEIIRGLADHNLNSVEKILNGGVDALKDVKGIGPVRAAIIFGYVKENFG